MAQKRPRVPTYVIIFDGRTTSGEIGDLIEDITITDKLEGESDSVEFKVNNYDAYWFDNPPTKGDRLIVSIGYRNEPMCQPIEYELDEFTYHIAPDFIAIKGQATPPVTKNMRQKYSFAYEDTTLADIAAYIAGKHGLRIAGQIPDIAIKRVTQKNETDLGFLKRIASKYGVIFKVDSCQTLVFSEEIELESRPPVIVMNRTLMKSSSTFTVKSIDTYQSASVQYRDPKTDELYRSDVGGGTSRVVDNLNVVAERFEEPGQTEKRAAEALRKANATEVEGTIDTEGEVSYIAGINIQITGLGFLDGKYQIREVRHSITTNAGFTSQLSVRKIQGEGGGSTEGDDEGSVGDSPSASESSSSDSSQDPTTSTSQQFEPVDRIYDGHLLDSSPPGSYDFTIERNGNVITSIPSPTSGTVTRSEVIDGYGNIVEVRGDDGYTWFIAHMDSRAVGVGDRIEAGQNLGNQGFTGHVIPANENGSHMHIEISHDQHGAGNPWNRVTNRNITRPMIDRYIHDLKTGGR